MIRLKTLLVEAAPVSEITKDNLEKAKIIVSGLIDRGFSWMEAITLAGNMSVESYTGGKWFTTSASDGRGIGLMQWTGARRTAFEAYAKYMGRSQSDLEMGRSQSDLETQLDFTKFELKDYYLLHPNDLTLPLRKQLIPGIPVGLVMTVDTKGNPLEIRGTKFKGPAQGLTISIKGTIADSTKLVTLKVFGPQAGSEHFDRRMNNAVAIANYIKPGAVPKQTDSTKKDNTKKDINTKETSNVYVVKSGDTLGGIANRNKTTVDAILKKNPGLRADKIRDGQKIKI